jgi:hypothetical protein
MKEWRYHENYFEHTRRAYQDSNVIIETSYKNRNCDCCPPGVYTLEKDREDPGE